MEIKSLSKFTYTLVVCVDREPIFLKKDFTEPRMANAKDRERVFTPLTSHDPVVAKIFKKYIEGIINVLYKLYSGIK